MRDQRFSSCQCGVTDFFGYKIRANTPGVCEAIRTAVVVCGARWGQVGEAGPPPGRGWDWVRSGIRNAGPVDTVHSRTAAFPLHVQAAGQATVQSVPLRLEIYTLNWVIGL